MVRLESLKRLGYRDYTINKWVEKNYIYIENKMVTIIDIDTYYKIMTRILENDLDLFDEFIDETYNESLKEYFCFLKLVLEGKLEEAIPLMRHILKDKNFLDEYEDILLYVSIIDEFELSDLYIPKEDNYLLKGQMEIFKNFLLSFNYSMAREMLKMIMEIHTCLEYRVIDAILATKKDNIRYILDESVYPSEVTRDNLKRIERETICELEMGEFTKFALNINNLNRIYQNQDCSCFKVIIELLNAVNILKHNNMIVASRSDLTFHGSVNSVLLALLTCQDYYRVAEVIEEAVDNSKGFDIYVVILYILKQVLMRYNKRNMENIEDKINKESNLFAGDIVATNPKLSVINGDVLKQKEERGNRMDENNINYYKKYIEAYNEGKYLDARINLLRFVKNLRSFGVYPNYEYLFKELDYLIDKKSNEVALSNQNEAFKLMENKEYDKAIIAIEAWCDSLDYYHPRAKAMLAKCYLQKGMLEEALNMFLEAEKYYLYPDNYEDIIIILYKLGRLSEIEQFYNLREEYDNSSLRIIYIMSLVELENKRYKKAKKYLKLLESRTEELYGFRPNYSEEKEIIDELSKGNEVSSYTERNYIEYGLTDEDKDVINLLKEYKETYGHDYIKMITINIRNMNSSLSEKITYLLKIIKVLKTQHVDNLDEIYQYADYLLLLDGITIEERERFTIMKKNYQNL